MADERYEWLDADAAEKLLRGEPVEPVGDQARIDALRVEAALREARTVPAAGGELPGEAAVLAAFRDAFRAGGRNGEGVRAAALRKPDATTALADRPGTLRPVRIGAAHTALSRRPRWSRPLRYGLVASLAGCALGGVAVAAGTGMLPGPFGTQGSPVPAVSVSAAASPEELGSGLPSGTGPSVAPSGSPGTSVSPAPSNSPEAAETGTDTGGDGPSGRDDGSKEKGGGVPDGNGDRDGAQDETDGDGLPDGVAGGNSGELYDASVRDCRDHRDGSLDKESKRRLVRLAKGEGNLDRFCGRLLDRAAGRNGSSEDGSNDSDGSSSDGAEGGGESGGGESGDGADTGEGSEGSIPSVSFDRSAPSPAAGGGDASRTDGERAPDADPRPLVTEPVALSASSR